MSELVKKKRCVCCREVLTERHFPDQDGYRTNICKACWSEINKGFTKKKERKELGL